MTDTVDLTNWTRSVCSHLHSLHPTPITSLPPTNPYLTALFNSITIPGKRNALADEISGQITHNVLPPAPTIHSLIHHALHSPSPDGALLVQRILTRTPASAISHHLIGSSIFISISISASLPSLPRPTLTALSHILSNPSLQLSLVLDGACAAFTATPNATHFAAIHNIILILHLSASEASAAKAIPLCLDTIHRLIPPRDPPSDRACRALLQIFKFEVDPHGIPEHARGFLAQLQLTPLPCAALQRLPRTVTPIFRLAMAETFVKACLRSIETKMKNPNESLDANGGETEPVAALVDDLLTAHNGETRVQALAVALCAINPLLAEIAWRKWPDVREMIRRMVTGREVQIVTWLERLAPPSLVLDLLRSWREPFDVARRVLEDEVERVDENEDSEEEVCVAWVREVLALDSGFVDGLKGKELCSLLVEKETRGAASQCMRQMVGDVDQSRVVVQRLYALLGVEKDVAREALSLLELLTNGQVVRGVVQSLATVQEKMRMFGVMARLSMRVRCVDPAGKGDVGYELFVAKSLGFPPLVLESPAQGKAALRVVMRLMRRLRHRELDTEKVRRITVFFDPWGEGESGGGGKREDGGLIIGNEDSSMIPATLERIKACAEEAVDILLCSFLPEYPLKELMEEEELRVYFEDAGSSHPRSGSVHRESALAIIRLMSRRDVNLKGEHSKGEEEGIEIREGVTEEEVSEGWAHEEDLHCHARVDPPPLCVVQKDASLSNADDALKRCNNSSEGRAILLSMARTVRGDLESARICYSILLKRGYNSAVLAPCAWASLMASTLVYLTASKQRQQLQLNLNEAESAQFVQILSGLETHQRFRTAAFICIKLLNKPSAGRVFQSAVKSGEQEIARALVHLFPMSVPHFNEAIEPFRKPSALVSLCASRRNWAPLITAAWELRGDKDSMRQLQSACELRHLLLRYTSLVLPVLADLLLQVHGPLDHNEEVLSALPHVEARRFLGEPGSVQALLFVIAAFPFEKNWSVAERVGRRLWRMLDLIKGKLKNEFKLVVKRAVEILLEISKAFPDEAKQLAMKFPWTTQTSFESTLKRLMKSFPDITNIARLGSFPPMEDNRQKVQPLVDLFALLDGEKRDEALVAVDLVSQVEPSILKDYLETLLRLAFGNGPQGVESRKTTLGLVMRVLYAVKDIRVLDAIVQAFTVFIIDDKFSPADRLNVASHAQTILWFCDGDRLLEIDHNLKRLSGVGEPKNECKLFIEECLVYKLNLT